MNPNKQKLKGLKLFWGLLLFYAGLVLTAINYTELRLRLNYNEPYVFAFILGIFFSCVGIIIIVENFYGGKAIIKNGRTKSRN